MYVKFENGEAVYPYEVPDVLRYKDGREFSLIAMTPRVLAPHGIYELELTEPPAETTWKTSDSSVEIVEGTPTLVWTERDKTQEEIDAEDEENTESAYPSEWESMTSLSRLMAKSLLVADGLGDDQVATLAGIFPSWEPGVEVAVGEVYRWDGTLVEVVQAHATQADWQPDQVPALFKIYRAAGSGPGGGPPEFVQPTGAQDAYALGDQVTFEGSIYGSLIAANVWSPSAYPAGWQSV